MRKICLIATAALMLAGCSENEQSSENKTPPKVSAEASQQAPELETSVANLSAEKFDPWQVVEAFEVGRDVYVRSLALEEKTNSLWVGTSVGVHEVDLNSQHLKNTFTRADGLANEYVFALFVDSQDYKWMGTNGGGTSRYKDGEWAVYFPLHGIADYWVYSFAEQSNGDVWIGTWDGVTRWQPQGGVFTTYVRELVNEWVYGIGVDSKDQLWFGTEGGVSMFDGKQWRSWTHADGLGAPNEEQLPISFNTGLGTRSRHDLAVNIDGQRSYNPNYIFSVHVDPQDHVWAGTWGAGVARFDGKTWTNYSANKDGLAGNVVYSMDQSEDGTMWFGTDQGLSRFDGEEWFNYGRQQGLLSSHVYAVSVVSSNEVWVGTRGGVTRLAKNQQMDEVQ